MKKHVYNPGKDEAGRLMTDKVPRVHLDNTIATVESHLLKEVKQLESINYIYVLGKDNSLKGVLSIKELFRQPKSKKVAAVMVREVVKARPHTDQEKVAYLALKNNIKAVPIVDRDDKFLGVVLSDDILKVTYNELQEDISRFAGLDRGSGRIDNIRRMPLLTSLKHRLPWLLIGILGGTVAAQVIRLFEGTLADNLILAAFIPLVVYIASAVGTQCGYFVVRDLALDRKLDFLAYVWRQFRVIVAMGIIISFLVLIFSLLFYHTLAFSLVLASAIFLTVLSSIVTGLFIPYLFSRLSYDPANASGPVATTIQDLISVTIYLTFAQAFL